MLSEKEKPGLWGEIYAARFMRENGYEIITANYRCRLGEIDIIAKKDGFWCSPRSRPAPWAR